MPTWLDDYADMVSAYNDLDHDSDGMPRWIVVRDDVSLVHIDPGDDAFFVALGINCADISVKNRRNRHALIEPLPTSTIQVIVEEFFRGRMYYEIGRGRMYYDLGFRAIDDTVNLGNDMLNVGISIIADASVALLGLCDMRFTADNGKFRIDNG